MRIGTGIGAGMVLAVCTACAWFGSSRIDQEFEKPAKQNVALMVGYLDMTDAEADYNFLQVRHLDPDDSTPIYGLRLHEQIFYSDVLPPGPYALYDFGEWQELHYQVPRQASPIQVQLEEPGRIYWVGAYKFVPVRRAGTFQRGRFDLEPLDHPTEAEALAEILPFSEGTPWHARIRARLEKLR